MVRTITAMAAAILSGLLLYASAPPLDLPAVVWIALIPLLLALRSAPYLPACCIAWLTGTVFYGLHGRWVGMVPGVPTVAYLALALYAGVFLAGFGFGFRVLVRYTRWPTVLLAPLLWVGCEFVRANLSFLAIPFALLGYSQHKNLAILQLASLTSVYGISFLIVLVNAALAEGVLWGLGHRSCARPQPSGTGALAALGVALVSLLLVSLWGAQQVRQLDGAAPGVLTASLIQGNIPQHEKWDPKLQVKVMQRYRDLTLRATQDRPDLVIWPEAATPGYLGRDPRLSRAVTALVRDTGIPLLLGSASSTKLGRERPERSQLKNSVFLLDGQGRVVSSYDKMRLLPFGEYLPLAGRFAWPRWLVPSNGHFIPGTSATVFELPMGRFGVVICWENFFSGLFRTFVQAGAQFMVNPTNEAWFAPEASRQFLVMSTLRAVEHRITLLRVANTGITSLIDPLGRVRERVRDEVGNDVMVTGILTVTVPAPLGPTFYTRYGDVFAMACSGVTVLCLISAALPVSMPWRCTLPQPQA